MSVQVVCPGCEAINRVPDQRLKNDWRVAKCPKCGSTLFPGKPIEVTTAGLQRHIEKSDVAVLVDFWAPWCGPCRTMAPAFAEAAAELSPSIRLLKLDTEAETVGAATHGIRSIPTLALFRGGRETARQTGAITTAQIGRWVNQHL